MSSDGLTISAWTPVWGTASTLVYDNLAEQLQSYSQVCGAMGGYISADIEIVTTLEYALRWFRDALGYDIRVADPAGVQIWNGFVDQIEVEIGDISIIRGPLLDIVNRAELKYQTISFDTNPPIGGDPVTTSVYNDTTSQGRYGILQALLSGGEMLEDEARQAVNRYLQEFKDPKAEMPQITLSESEVGTAVTLRISCVGYYKLFEKYLVGNTGATGEINLSQKVKDVIDADPSSRFSYNDADITENTTQVGDYDDGESTAWDILKAMIERSDEDYKRYLFQVLDGRKCYYYAVPTTIEYLLGLSDSSRQIKTSQEQTVHRWNVKSGKWLMVTDFLEGIAMPSDLAHDPRVLFIESATYQAPWYIALAGGKVSLVEQMFARFGLGGV